jgi:hypothetical protein
MSEHSFAVTRRDLIRTGAGIAVGATIGSVAWGQQGKREARKAAVTIVRNERVFNPNHRVNIKVLTEMLAETVQRVTGAPTARDGWRMLVKEDDVVGLVSTPHLNPTHIELVDVVRSALGGAGVAPHKIRDTQGSKENAAECTALISLPALKAHWLTGIGTVLKNYIMFSGAPSRYHDEANDKLGEIWLLPEVKGKTRLVLVDALRPLCDKGPQVDPRYLWDYKGLIAGTDPVAVEAVCLKLLNAKREAIKGEPWPLTPPPLCVAMADQRYGLGTARLDEITIGRYGWADEVLV